MNEEYYREQIIGLYLILSDGEPNDFMISRSYVKEKLSMILHDGINFHPSIKKVLDDKIKRGTL